MPHISFSALKVWNECPYKHKLTYIDKIEEFRGNAYTAFGSAIHEVCEKILLKEYDHSKAPEKFRKAFISELNSLPQEIKVNLDENLLKQMLEQGLKLAPLAIPYLEKHFGKFEIISSEEQLYEPITEYSDEDYDFKGFIDLVIRTEDDKYHIVDWKTCSWGWDMRRKSEPMTTYQLTLYKHYYAQKHDINPKDVETHFALLKRTAKKDQVEIFRVTSGQKKSKNALNLLNKALYNIDKNIFIKNRLSCRNCGFYKTIHCK
tara:strand:+ start:1305 stop:2087 length:783 start_codon:yes stop_codon:yes gene_type:complete